MNSFDITHFNPGSQRESDFLASFIARQDVLQFFLTQLRNTNDRQSAKHHLIVAPRGYGKTALLRRISIALRDEDEFKKRYIALVFREEQHNVISLDVFWRNCLQALLEAREDEKASSTEIVELEQLWKKYSPRNSLKRERQDGEPAWAAFAEHCHKLGRRPVLLMDNLDALLAGLDQHQWGLRTVLQKSDGPILIAAASRYPESLSDTKAAFFDFFRVTNLPRLSDQEVMTCLRELAKKREDRGVSVLQMLDTDPGRISALNTMAGGNPRTLGVLYMVLEAHMSDDVLAQLSAMLDTFTGWYQARAEELPLQSRAVFDALALNWDPMMAASIGEITGLDTPTVSSHLSRLEKSGYVEAVPLSKTKKARNGYQVSERFFNIWYLMRNGPRRTRQSIYFLTKFLSACFSNRELRVMAKDKLNSDVSRIESTLALAASIGDTRLRMRLLNTAESCIGQHERADELRFLVNEMRKDGKSIDRQLPSSATGQAQRLMKKFQKHIDAKQFDLAETVCRQIIELDEKNAASWSSLGSLLHYSLGRYEEAEEAYRKAAEVDGRLATPWGMLGDLLRDHLARYEESEAAYRKAIELDEKWAAPWIALGDLLEKNLGHHEDAEVCYRKATNLDDKSAIPWIRLGDILHHPLGLYEEAETAYRRAIELDEEQSYSWYALGTVLHYHLDQYEQAEVVYRKAITLDEKAPFHWDAMGDLLQDHLDRYADSEAAYRKAIELDEKWASPWAGLGRLLKYHLDRYADSEAAYRKAIELDEKWASPWIELGDLLNKKMGRYVEAEEAFRKAVKLNDKSVASWGMLGDLLRDHLDRYEEAEYAYRKVIDLNKKSLEGWISLGNLLQDFTGKYEESKAAYEQGLLSNPGDSCLLANSVYLCALHLGDVKQARDYAGQARKGSTQVEVYLMEAALAWSDGRPDSAIRGWNDLHQAVEHGDDALWSLYLDDLQRVIAYAAVKGDGLLIKGWMEEANYPLQYAPLYHAYCALLDGEDYLLKINPEVRGMAEKIYGGLARIFNLFRQHA